MASTKISDLVSVQEVRSGDDFVIVRDGINYKVDFSTFSPALGVTGTISTKSGGTPLYDLDASDYSFKELLGDNGVQISLDPSQNLVVSNDFTSTPGDGVALAPTFTGSQIVWRKLQAGAGIDITPDVDGNAVISNLADASEGLLSKVGNSTETQIAIVSTPVKVNVGSVVTELINNFTSDGLGRLTYNDVNPSTVNISAALSIRAATAGAKSFIVYVAINGSVVNGSRQRIATDLTLVSVNLVWRAELSLNDYVEVFVSNTTDTDNCLVTDYQLRVG
jgi:hypothetical protein